MATTEHFYEGNNSTTDYSFTFPYLKTDDIKVHLDAVATTAYSLPNSTTVRFNTAPGDGVDIHIFRDTDVDTAKATFAAGSSIRAADLNNNEDQALYSLQEKQGQLVKTADIKDNAITASKIVANAVGSAQIADNAVTSSELASDSVGSTQIKDNAVGSSEIASSAVGNTQIADNAVTAAKIAGNAVGSAQIAADAVRSAQIQDGAVGSAALAADSVGSAQIADSAVGASEIAADAVRSAQIQDGAVGSSEIAADAVGTAQIADNAVTAAQIAADAVGTTQIADAELTTLAGMQLGTASMLAGNGVSVGTALTSNIDELNLLDGKSIVESISGSSTHIELPTAKAVNDQIVSLMQDVGGFYPIDDELKFPNVNPDPNDDAGTIVSIADAGGVVVNGSGVSTTGRTLGGSTVTINGIDSSLYNTTIAAGKGMLVQTTSTLNTYKYHRLIVDESGVADAQTLVSDFNQRYRVGSSNPSTSLDDGDLFFNTGTGKMLVYNANNTAWEEVQSVGNFYINTISSYSGTGGNSASFNGSAYRFVLSNAPTNAEQLLVSVNGVVQKPVAGTSQPSEGFSIDGSSILFSSAPASGSDYFIVTIGSAVNIGTPSDNTVTNAILQSGCVDNSKVATDAAIAGSKLADDSIAEVKLDVHNAPSGTDKFLAYTSNGMEWAVPTDTNTQLSFSNDANNRVVTGDGSGGLNGEANLTFDGSDFAVTGNTTLTGAAGSDALTVQLTNDNAEGVTIIGGSTQGRTNLSLKAGRSDGGITALRLENSSGTSFGSFFFENDTDDINIMNSSQGGNIFFHTNESGSSLKKVTIQDDGHVKIHNGDLVIGTSGHGIDFSATSDGGTVSSEVLADYEEGTFVPSVSANLTLDTNYDTWGYVKVGKMVTVRGYFVPSAVSGSTSISLGLPFAVENWTERANYGGSGTMFKHITGDYGTVAAYTAEGVSTMKFYRCQGDNTAWSSLSNAHISTDSRIYFSHTYFAA